MLDFYQILGIPRSADPGTIKAAYKKLALKYHPDRNSGDKWAEEQFKQVNEAYQTLIDPQKKNRYDFLLNYSYQTKHVYTTPKPPPRQPPKETNVYNRYGRYDWRNAPRYKTAPVYKVDKNYFKNQVLAFAVVIAFAAIAVSFAKINQYLDEKEAARIEQYNNQKVAEAQTLYNKGQYRESLEMIIKLENDNPIEHKFYEAKDQMLSNLNIMAVNQFNEADYSQAVSKLEVLRDFQHPMRLKTWQLMAECYMKLEEYRKAAHAYDYILIRDAGNLQLMLKIAELYQYKLNNIEKAIDYYTEARYTFKKYQSDAYGDAFEFIIDPKEVPESYFEMFKIRAELMFKQANYEEVIKDCNWAIFLRPERSEMYFLRGRAKYNLGQKDRACLDLKRALDRGLSINSVKNQIICD